MSHTALLLSIRPRFSDLIFNGSKQIELRRRRPKIGEGDLVFVYVSSPVKALTGAFEVKRLVEKAPATLWREWGGKSGLRRSEFFEYFSGVEVGYGIVIARAWQLPAPVQLAALRKRHVGFRPPQAYHYLPINHLNRLGATHDKARFPISNFDTILQKPRNHHSAEL